MENLYQKQYSLAKSAHNSKPIFILVKYNIPTLIAQAGKPLSIEQLKSSINIPNLNIDILSRIMRFCTVLGYFVEQVSLDDPDIAVYSLTELGNILRNDIQPNLRDMTYHYTFMMDAFTKLSDKLISPDESYNCFSQNFGKGVFDLYGEDMELGTMFGEYMKQHTQPLMQPIISLPYWDQANKKQQTVVDIGGSQGHVIGAIKGQFSNITAINFDLPQMIDQIQEKNDQIQYVRGSFFEKEQVPKGDIYFLKHILHDWNDELCQQILENLSHSLNLDGKILICEVLLPEIGQITEKECITSSYFYIDITMMLINSKERSIKQYNQLFEYIGFKLSNKIDLVNGYHILEFIKK